MVEHFGNVDELVTGVGEAERRVPVGAAVDGRTGIHAERQGGLAVDDFQMGGVARVDSQHGVPSRLVIRSGQPLAGDMVLVAEQERGVVRPLDHAGDDQRRVGEEQVVAVDRADVSPAAFLKTPPHGATDADVGKHADDANPRDLGQLGQHFQCAWGVRAVVDDHPLEGDLSALGVERVEQRPQILGGVFHAGRRTRAGPVRGDRDTLGDAL